VGPIGPQGPVGPQGNAGPSGVVGTGYVAGYAGAAIYNPFSYEFVGPVATVTIQSGQKLVAFGSVPLGVSTNATYFIPDIGYRLAGSGTSPTNASGGGYMICMASPGGRASWSVNTSIALPAGTYEIGVVVGYNYGPLDDNDYVNMTWMVVN